MSWDDLQTLTLICDPARHLGLRRAPRRVPGLGHAGCATCSTPWRWWPGTATSTICGPSAARCADPRRTSSRTGETRIPEGFEVVVKPGRSVPGRSTPAVRRPGRRPHHAAPCRTPVAPAGAALRCPRRQGRPRWSSPGGRQSHAFTKGRCFRLQGESPDSSTTREPRRGELIRATRTSRCGCRPRRTEAAARHLGIGDQWELLYARVDPSGDARTELSNWS